ncbi:MAG TPA: tetratricopeptide repeat protein [Gemmatimonadales bacterium]|nr:tetratricopeptide repeat protein [Gemmatimonadales bacterium]
MYRPLMIAGIGYLAVCAVVAIRLQPRSEDPLSSTPDEWFAAMRPTCNAVEVAVSQRRHPAPNTVDGQGYSAACYALGGRIDSARAVINRLPRGDRAQAAGIVFNVGHPVADVGDDRSAGPIMELVLEYQPDQYMALYHAGMSEYALGQPGKARRHLQSFLSRYHENDGWTFNARSVLQRMRP